MQQLGSNFLTNLKCFDKVCLEAEVYALDLDV